MGMGCLVNAQIIILQDEETGKPVSPYWVTVEGLPHILESNSEGEVDITSFAERDWIEITSAEYPDVRYTMDELSTAGYVIKLQKSDVQLNPVVVSATRWNQQRNDVPHKVATLTNRDIDLFAPQTSADLLGASGEVFVQKSQLGGGSPMIRGFATNRLLYTVDGVRMNTAIFRAGNVQNVLNLDPFANERVEIFYGPGSVIYGSDAIGGVMSFTTIKPKFSLTDNPVVSGRGLMQTSSANKEFTAHFDLQTGWKKWALATSFSSFDFKDLHMGRYGPDEYLRPFSVQRIGGADVIVANPDQLVQVPSGYSQINLMQKVRFRPTERLDFEFATHYSATSSYSRYDRHIRYRGNGDPRYGEWNYGPQSWWMNNFTVTHQALKGFYDNLSLRVAYQLFEESRIDRDLNDPIRHIREEKVDAWSANLDFTKAIGGNMKLFYGLEGVINKVKSTGIDEDIDLDEAVDGPSRYPQADWRSFALYAQAQRNFGEKFLVEAGLRYNAFSIDAEFDTRFYPFPFTEANLNNGALTGSIGARYAASKSVILRAAVSTGFRSPNVDDLGKVFDSEVGSVVVPNPDLRAEYALNFEVGAAFHVGKALHADLSLYHTILNNAMVRRDFTLNGMDSIIYDGELSQVQAIQNAAIATVSGVQLDLDVVLGAGFTVGTKLNYQHGEEELDDGSKSTLRHAPPFFGRFEIGYQYQALRVLLYSNFSAQRNFEDLPEEEKGKPEIYAIDDNGNPYSPSWYTFNLKASYDIDNRITISAGLDNITDVRYRPYSSGIVSPGRNMILSAQVRF